MSDVYRMPDGRITKNAEKYVAAWRAISDPLERHFDMRLHAFDPDLVFYVKPYGTVTLPIPMAESIAKLVQDYETLRQETT